MRCSSLQICVITLGPQDRLCFFGAAGLLDDGGKDSGASDSVLLRDGTSQHAYGTLAVLGL